MLEPDYCLNWPVIPIKTALKCAATGAGVKAHPIGHRPDKSKSGNWCIRAKSIRPLVAGCEWTRAGMRPAPLRPWHALP
ncbi:hypothetical protein ACFX58_07385 [Sphingomonas sp. NCPPB 2930]